MSQEEITNIIKGLLKTHYDGIAEMEYIDIFDDRIDQFENIRKLVDEESTPLPIVAFGEEPVFAGYLSYPHVTQELFKRGIKPI